ncbi:VCBS repeat-containing protein [Luteolibacter ambystomatis]|uniref:VCBS repeat-containing protein n=1 Tax=Luteolibacter ambystomatis TaxID=2824561 RepID=A0A975J276_9BACT|nr:FG-GAP-like repeat-containing protein [Luteolibacter ambystomatis]QUE52678.1 VCBS repeat-containing protein [Luteolibacter ambystomatis]
MPARSALVAAALAMPVAASAAVWDVPAESAIRSFWEYANFSGTPLFTMDTPSGREVIVKSGSFWYAMVWDPATSSFQQKHVAPAVGSALRIVPARMTGGATPEIVAGYNDGTVLAYDPVTFELVKTVQIPVGFSTTPRGMQIADVDGDGLPEIVAQTSSALSVYDRNGVLLWTTSLSPSGTTWDIAVGQVDDDPAKEIVLSSGRVIDCATHAIQWTRPSDWPTWSQLVLADANGDGRDEVYSFVTQASSYGFSAADVQENRLLINQPRSSAVKSLTIADIDDTPGLELLIGDAEGISGYSLNGGSFAFDFGIYVPDGGAESILAGRDVDGDGVKDLLVSPNGSSVGDFPFLLVRGDTLAGRWAGNTLLGSPFLPPVVGDITGDGIPEIIGASSYSFHGNVVVFDCQSLEILATSDQLPSADSNFGITSVKLRDVDGDGTKEIVITGDHASQGDISILHYEPGSRTFHKIWSNPDKPADASYTNAEIVDLDGDGRLEVVAVNKGGDGSRVSIIDYTTGTVEWRSPILGTDTKGFTCMEIGDVDGDGAPEVVLCGTGNGLAVVDLVARSVELSVGGGVSALTLQNNGFTLGKTDGKTVRYTATAPGTYSAGTPLAVSNAKISGLLSGSDQGLWINSGNRFQYWPDSTGPIWSTETRATLSDGVPGLLWTADGYEAFGGYEYGFSAFETAPAGVEVRPAVGLSLGALAISEGSQAGSSFTVSRTGPTSSPLDVRLTLAGTASISDVTIQGAANAGDGMWVATIPAGSATTAGTIKAVDDTLAEGPEKLVVALVPGNAYKVDFPGVATLDVADNETAVSIALLNGLSQASETAAAGSRGFVISRTGDLSKALKVNLVASGSATAAKDYRKLPTTATIAAGQSSVTVPFTPTADKIVEGIETVTLTVTSGTGYGTIAGRSAATIELLDVSSVVSLQTQAPSVSGVDVPVVRSGGLEQSVTFTLVEEKNPVGGRPSSTRRRVTFPAHASSAVYHVKSAKAAFGCTVSLLPDTSFVLGDKTSATFTVTR